MFKPVTNALLQVVVVVSASTALALAGNAIRWDKSSVDLSREYFKVAPTGQARIPAPTPPVADPANGNAATDDAQADTAVDDDAPTTSWHGFQMATYEQARAIFDNSFYETGIYLFVDARDDTHYVEAHVRGAVQIDHYRVDEYMPDLLDTLMDADMVVVYCNGGQCEDSIFVCTDLTEAGIPYDRVYLYEGGIKEWQANNAPTVSGTDPWGQQ